MKRKTLWVMFLTLMTLSVGLIASCSKSKSGSEGSASATLKFSNVVNQPLGFQRFLNLLDTLFFQKAFAVNYEAATQFKMKLIAAYLTEDINPTTQNNMGMTSMFYLNPDCQDDIMHCDISGGTAEDGQPMSKVVSNYFDFGLTSEAVNAALNAQSRSISPTTYKYVRLEFCKYNHENSQNIIWGGHGVDSKSFQRNSCTVNSAVMDPPLQVADGDSVTVRIAYDYSQSISIGSGSFGDDCSGSGDQQVCFRLPSFTPSASH